MKKDCTTCESCQDTLEGLNSKLISIVDKRLYNVRYELNRNVDYPLARLLSFYKVVLSDICDGADCDCYTSPQCSALQNDIPNTGNPDAVINTCICGCCEPLNPVCNVTPCVSNTCIGDTCNDTATALTKENIIERIKILTA